MIDEILDALFSEIVWVLLKGLFLIITNIIATPIILIVSFFMKQSYTQNIYTCYQAIFRFYFKKEKAEYKKV